MSIKKIIAKYFGKRKPSSNQDLSRIESVLFHPIGDAIGDAIAHCLHIRQLKVAYPNIKVGVFITDRNRSIFEKSEFIDELITIKPFNYLLNRNKWDLYLDFTPKFNSLSLILDRILSPQRVMIFLKTPKKHYSLDNIHTYDFYKPLPELVHIKDYLKYSALGPYLSSIPELFYELSLSSTLKEKADTLWQSGKFRILICPQGSTPARQLPAEECGQILANINDNFVDNLDIQFSYGSYCDQYLAEINKHFKNIPSIRKSVPTSLDEYLALINSADLILAVDSGSVHISCAFSKPLLAFYADYPSNIAKWYPHTKAKDDTLILVGKQNATNSDVTRGFNIEKACYWLNSQIAKYR